MDERINLIYQKLNRVTGSYPPDKFWDDFDQLLDKYTDTFQAGVNRGKIIVLAGVRKFTRVDVIRIASKVGYINPEEKIDTLLDYDKIKKEFNLFDLTKYDAAIIGQVPHKMHGMEKRNGNISSVVHDIPGMPPVIFGRKGGVLHLSPNFLEQSLGKLLEQLPETYRKAL